MDKCFCCYCGNPTAVRTPEGDHRPRRVCPACGVVHYENPRVVVGCVPEHEHRILICLRATAPRRGYWTIPAGFLENGESMEDGAARECFEEALAKVKIGPLLALVNIPEAHQVHVFFRARLTASAFGAGEESLDAKLVEPGEIPWDELAFPSTRFALQCYLQERERVTGKPYLTTLARRHPG